MTKGTSEMTVDGEKFLEVGAHYYFNDVRAICRSFDEEFVHWAEEEHPFVKRKAPTWFFVAHSSKMDMSP